MDLDSDASHSEDALSLSEIPVSFKEYNDIEAKQRASVLWLLSKAYMPKIPPELYEPCYRDHEGNDRLKPQIVHALANAELYCLALANIYADPNYHSLNHHGIIQVLTRKGIEINEPMDANLTETVLVQTAPIRMNAHMAVIEGIMALFIKEVLIPEKVVEVVSRFSIVDAESELPYDCEEAALLWINKSCLKVRQNIEEDLGFGSNPSSPDSSHALMSYKMPFIALAQDLGDLSDGCCIAALLSLYCPRYFKWQDIHFHDPISLADSVHNLQLIQNFCQEHLPQDVYCLSLEDMVYMHPSIIPNILAFVADLMYIFEIRPPKHICRPGARNDREDDSKVADVNHLNGQRQSPVQNCRIRNFQKASSPIPDLRSGNYEINRSGSWQRPQKSMSARKINVQDERKFEGSRHLRRTYSVNFSEVNRKDHSHADIQQRVDEDEELAGYFSPKHSQSQHDLLDQEDNRRLKQSSTTSRQSHAERNYQDLNSPGQLESLNENNEMSSGKWAEPREQTSKPTLHRSPSSYEIHQLSPSKQTVAKGRGYSCQRSQSDMHLSQGKHTPIKQTQESDNNLYQVQSVSHEHYSPRTFTREPRRNRNSFHESSHSRSDTASSSARRYSVDCTKLAQNDLEVQPKTLSGSLTWRKPKDLFTQSEWNKENFDSENNAIQSSEDNKASEDQVGVMSFANLSKQKNNSGSAINIVYSHHDKDVDHGTYKKPVRPGYLHINKYPNIEDSSPSTGNVSEWINNSGQNISTNDSSVAAQMYDIRLKLEEKRKRIEQEKTLLESLSKRQREKMGKAAFLQAVKGGCSPGKEERYSDNTFSKSRQFSVEDISEELDTVRRKWLERKNAGIELENDMQQEDIQLSIDQLNSSLSELQTDISRLTEQQEVIQKMIKSGSAPQNDAQAYYLHDQNASGQNKIPSKWAEASNSFQNNNSAFQQGVMPSDVHQTVSSRGHWGQPVIPFGGYQQPPPPQHQNIPMWQQTSQAVRPPSMEPHMMYSQPMNMQPPQQVPFNQGFTLHPQQQMQHSNYSNYYNPHPYYNEVQHNNVPNQSQFNYSNYHQSNYPVIQNSYNQSAPVGLERSESRGFHLHDDSFDYKAEDNSHLNSQRPFTLQRNMSQSETPQNNSNVEDNILSSVDQSRAPESPPTRPVLGKTFRVPKPKVKSPSPTKQELCTEEPADKSDSKQLNDKGFYISFEEEPRKPKPKLKPKHLKARSQQKKVDSDSRKQEFNQNAAEESRESGMKSSADDVLDGKETDSTSAQNVQPSQPPHPGVGFVVDASGPVDDPDKELEMTRRKEMIMMMSLRRRAEQEKKKNEKQQEYLRIKEEERVKREQIEKKKEEEKLRRQLILEQYRQRKAQEEEDGMPGGPSRGREETTSASRGATMTRSKSRSASATRPRQRSGQASRNQNLSSPSSLDSPVSRGSQYNLAGGYSDEVSSEHGYTPSPCRTRNYPHSSPISPTSYPSSPGPLLSGMLGVSCRNRSTPSDGLSDSSSTVSSAWASEYNGPKLFVRPSTKSNRGIITNAVNTVLAGAVNAETKRKVLEEMENSEGKHFLILFRDAGCQFRALYSYNPETEEVIKLYGIGPRIITDKIMDRFYKYNSGGKSFTQIHTKHLTATIDAFTIQNSLWQGKKTAAAPKKDYY